MKASTIKWEIDNGIFTRSKQPLPSGERMAKLSWLEKYETIFPSVELAEFIKKHRALSATMAHTSTEADRVIHAVAAKLDPIHDAVVLGKIPMRTTDQSDQERLNALRTQKRLLDNEIGVLREARAGPRCPGREQRQQP